MSSRTALAECFYRLIAILCVTAVPVSFVLDYGRKWTVGGAYGVPVPLLSEDRLTYADGAPASELERWLVATGQDDEFSLAALVVAGVAIIACIAHAHRLKPPAESIRTD